MYDYTKQKGSGVAWVALVVALIALVLAWVAFNRTGADVEEIIERESDQIMTELQAEFDALEQEFRAETSQELREAAEDTATDEDPNSIGE